jgi:hypothetical protein
MTFRRRAHDPIVAILSLCAAGCGAHPEDPAVAAQTLCDGSAEVRLAYRSAGGFVPDTYAFSAAYGLGYLAIDGGCRYWAGGSGLDGLRTGTLAPEAAARAATDLHLAELPGLSAYPDNQSCPDASGYYLGSGGHSINCTCGCDDLPAAIPHAFQNAALLQMKLVATGPSSEGPLRALAIRMDQAAKVTPPPGSVFPWPLASSPAALVSDRGIDATSGPQIDAEADRRALRALRASAASAKAELIFVVSEGTLFALYLRDEPPDPVAHALTTLGTR